MCPAHTRRRDVGRKYKLLHLISCTPPSCRPRAYRNRKQFKILKPTFCCCCCYTNYRIAKSILTWENENDSDPVQLEPACWCWVGRLPGTTNPDEVFAVIPKAISLGAGRSRIVPTQGSSPFRESCSFLYGVMTSILSQLWLGSCKGQELQFQLYGRKWIVTSPFFPVKYQSRRWST